MVGVRVGKRVEVSVREGGEGQKSVSVRKRQESVGM